MMVLASDVRELSFGEIDAVSGGWRASAARWIANAILGGMAYDAAKSAYNAAMDEVRDQPNPFLADREASR